MNLDYSKNPELELHLLINYLTQLTCLDVITDWEELHKPSHHSLSSVTDFQIAACDTSNK